MSKCLTAGCGNAPMVPPSLYAPTGLCEACEEAWAKRNDISELSASYVYAACEQARLPPRIAMGVKETPLTRKAVTICGLAFADRKGLLMTGPTGSGKTLTLSIFARTLVLRGGNVVMYSVPELADKLRDAVQCAGGVQTYLVKLQGVRHLILDDFGAECDSSGWFRSVLHSVLDYRYTKGLVTSAGIAVPEQVGGAIMRRLQENTLAFDLKGGA